MISIGDALLKIGVDKRDFDRDMKGLRGSIEKHRKAIGIAMVGMGVAALGAAAASIKAFADMGDEVQKMALRTGFSTEALSELRHAAEISGANLSTLEKGVKRMSGTILDAQDGLETYVRAFRHIGIEVEELDGLNPEQQFLRIAEAIAEVEDPTRRAAIAQDIFGRAGTELLPLFAHGKEGLADLREEAHKLGIVFDQEAADKAANFKDSLTRLKGAVNGMKFALAEALLPAVDSTTQAMTDLTKSTSSALKSFFDFLYAWEQPIKLRRAWRDMMIERQKFMGGLSNELGKSLDVLESTLKSQGKLNEQAKETIRKLREQVKAREDEKRALEKEADALEELAKASEKTTDDMLDDIRDLTDEAKDSARKRTRAEIDAIDDRMKAARDAHRERMDALRDEYDQIVRTIDAELDYALKGYRNQIDAIDKQIEAIDDAERGRRDAERKGELEASIAEETDAGRRADLEDRLNELLIESGNHLWQHERKLAYEARIEEEEDADERKRLEQKLADFLLEVQAKRTKKQLEISRETLRQEMDMAREEARNAKDRAQETYDHKRKLQEREHDNLISQLDGEKGLLNQALEEKLQRYDDDLAAFEALLAQEIEDTEAFVVAYNELIGQLKDKTATITTDYETVGEPAPAPPTVGGPVITPGPGPGGGGWIDGTYVPGYWGEKGGIAMRPISARIAEKAPEAIIPLDRTTLERLGLSGGGFKTADIRIYLDRRLLAEELGQALVESIRLRTGIKI